MKHKPLFLLILLFVLFLHFSIIPVYAYTNYDARPAENAEEQEHLIIRSENFELTREPVKDRLIKCFSISQDGKIALAFDGTYAQVDVYDASGAFLYGYRFPNNNNAFSVFFEAGLLSIYHSKGNYIASFDSQGNCVQILIPRKTEKTSDGYYSDFYRPAEGKIGNLSYSAHAKIAILQYVLYDSFSVVDPSGNETLIYAVSEKAHAEMAAGAVFFGALTVGVLIIVYRNRSKNNA